jgi:hypothetical protein
VTPNHPSYISGHSGHSAAAAAVLAAFFDTDTIGFSLTTDSLPGGVTHSFDSFSDAVREVSDARVYAGIHWRFDVAAGEALGSEVGNYVVSHCLLPRDDDHGDGQLRAAAPAPVNRSLRAELVQPLPAEALARRRAAGVDTSALNGTDVRIADPGGRTPGEVAGGVIWSDDDAAGWGWLVDATPRDDSEFITPGDQGEVRRTDFLTVLEDEIRHLLGRDHEADGLGAAQTQSAWNADTAWIDHGFVSRGRMRK